MTPGHDDGFLICVDSDPMIAGVAEVLGGSAA